MDHFRIIAITLPDFRKDESRRIMEILQNGDADLVHIRKPGSSFEEMLKLIDSISPEFYPQLKIHDHFPLMNSYHLAGVHLNSRNPEYSGKPCSVSCSFHSIEQLGEAKHYDYITISPIFDSISKPGYRSAFSLNDLSPFLPSRRIVALGGVTPDRLPLLKKAGFGGAAMMGYFWSDYLNL